MPADRLGVLVWQDMPQPPAATCTGIADAPPVQAQAQAQQTDSSGGGGTPACALNAAAFESDLREMVATLSFSAALVLWVVFNEASARDEMTHACTHAGPVRRMHARMQVPCAHRVRRRGRS